MAYPKLVYKTPGPHGRPGRTYQYRQVTDEETERAALKDGWYAGKAEMFDSEATRLVAQAEELEEAIDEISPPTREELERKAEELGVPFNSRTKDETLLARIAEATE